MKPLSHFRGVVLRDLAQVKSGCIEIQGEHRDRLVRELCWLGFEARRAGG